jgi:adenine-specific DNA-methyltransferase
VTNRFVVEAASLGSDPAEALVRATNRIVLGDCLQTLRALPDGAVDLIHTSPPYNIDKGYKADFRDRRHIESYADFLAAAIFEMRRVLKPNGSLFWQTGYTDAPGGVEGDILPIDHLSYAFFREEPAPLVLWDRIVWRYSAAWPSSGSSPIATRPSCGG